MFRFMWKFECGRSKTQFRSQHNWKKPSGYDTKIEVYDERVKAKVPLIFPNKNYVKWYMCGPTVYDTSHVGHASCYVKFDIIHRILKEYYDIHPVVAIGVTDVSDEIHKKAKLLNKPISQITNKYTTEFFEQMDALNVIPPAFKLKVSKHMGIIIEFIDLLLRRRMAYVGINGSVYFSVEADRSYGKFRLPPVEESLGSADGKRDPRDFILWKLQTNGEWNSPWGRGAPGWHIECSAMASLVFGATIDLHSGGSDLIFPHHENEEAQSRCYHKCEQWVNYWLHTGMIKIGNVKMSKSLNNYLPVSEFLENYKSDHLRMFCLISSYRADLNFDDQMIQLAVNTVEKISRFLDMAQSYVAGSSESGNVDESKLLEEFENTKDSVKRHLANDFGTAEALKSVMFLIKICTRMLRENCETTSGRSPAVIAMLSLYVKQFFRSFGFTFTEIMEKNENASAINTVLNAAVNARAQVRNVSLTLQKSRSKNLLLLCDQFRDKLRSSGVEVTDISPSQSHWSFKPHTDNKMMLKEVIDYTVWFRKEILALISKSSVTEELNELSDICRHLKLFFGTLGVDIRDKADGRVEWTFPNPDKENSRILDGVILSTLQFQSQVRESAKELPEGKTKEELMCYCESIIYDLDGLGVKVDEKKKIFEIKEEAGMFLLNNLVDIAVHFRDQILVVANASKDTELKTNLFRLNGSGRKTLASFGFYIREASSNLLSSWSMKFHLVNSMVFNRIVDIMVNLLSETMKFSKMSEDKVVKLILLDICNSAVADLRSMGIVVKDLGKRNPTWSFQPSKFQDGYPPSYSPQALIKSSQEHASAIRDL